jgi:hypothetical protein
MSRGVDIDGKNRDWFKSVPLDTAMPFVHDNSGSG